MTNEERMASPERSSNPAYAIRFRWSFARDDDSQESCTSLLFSHRKLVGAKK